MRRGYPTLVVLMIIAALLAACGSDDGGQSTTTTARADDCQMAAGAARAIHRRVVDTPRPSRSGAAADVIMHELTKDEASTSTDESPDGRDVFILVNEAGGLAGLRGTTGSRSVSLTARRGCGAVAYLRHAGPTGAQFTLNGRDAGGVGPTGEQ